jgi:hypothetical protein
MSRRAGFLAALAGFLLAAAHAQAAWLPDAGGRYDIQLTPPFNLVRSADILELDLFATSPEQIKALKAKGVRTVCYINAGAWETWRADSREYPPGLIGKPYSGWPGERWVDIRQRELLGKVLGKRLDLCKAKGFDGVDFDNVDGYAKETGFPLTVQDQLAFNKWLAAEAKRRQLAVGLRNSLELVPQLVDRFDFAVSESCFSDGTCGALQPFLDAGKTVVVVEYTNVNRKMSRFCDEAQKLGVQLLLKTKTLTGKLHRRCM